MIELSDLSLMLKNYGMVAKTYVGINYQWLPATVLGLFTLVNSIRIFAYVPQMVTAAKDVNGASGVSYITWALFLLSHVTTIAYAIVDQGDLVMAFIFLGNALACLAIIMITLIKRRRYSLVQKP